MFRSFSEVEKHILENKIVKTIALAGAHDEPALSAVIEAKKKSVAKGLLIGDEKIIITILNAYGENERDYEIINETDEKQAAALAISKIREGSADIPMKGLMQTSTFMRAILNKETGILPEGKILSQSTVYEYPEQNRIMFAADCAVNIAPGLQEKISIVKNTVELAHFFGFKKPKVAVLSAVEKVNEKIPSTVDADELSKMSWSDCIVEGPFALDNAISPEAAKHKGVNGNVAGYADILLMPDLCAGNIFHKFLHFYAHTQTAGALCGTEIPVIMTSRTDSPEKKYYSILTAILQSL